jgi:hypothetical protein
MTDSAKNRYSRALVFTLCLVIIAWIAGSAVQSVQAKPGLCKEGIYQEEGNDQIFQTGDQKRVEDFIEKTGVHLYVHSLTEVYFQADTVKEYEQVYMRGMQQACSDEGYPLPDGGAIPRKSIFVIFGGTYNQDGVLFQTPAVAASDDLSKEVDVARCDFYAQVGMYGRGYATSSLNAFLDSLQPMLS